MIDHKREIVLLLDEKTAKGVIPWECTARNHCFRCVITEKYYFEIEENSDYIDTKSYVLSVVSARGTTIEEIKDEDLKQSMQNIFLNARKISHGGIRVIEELCRKLKDM